MVNGSLRLLKLGVTSVEYVWASSNTFGFFLLCGLCIVCWGVVWCSYMSRWSQVPGTCCLVRPTCRLVSLCTFGLYYCDYELFKVLATSRSGVRMLHNCIINIYIYIYMYIHTMVAVSRDLVIIPSCGVLIAGKCGIFNI